MNKKKGTVRPWPQFPSAGGPKVTTTYILYAGGFEVNLDSRKLRSPSGIILKLPTEGLAHAIANEWNMQNDTVKMDRMPLVSELFCSICSN